MSVTLVTGRTLWAAAAANGGVDSMKSRPCQPTRCSCECSERNLSNPLTG